MRYLLVMIVMLGCGRGSSASGPPAGTTSDPVTTCARVGDVCRIDQSQLGVCTHDQARGIVCAAQH
jgi:hypothetical protein